jgi:hypothetical protein
MRMLRRVRQAAADAAAQPCAHCGAAAVTAVAVTAPETYDDIAATSTAHTASMLLHTRPETAPVPCRPNTAANPGARRHSSSARRTKSAGVGRLNSSHEHSSSSSNNNSSKQPAATVQAVEDTVSCTAVHSVPEVESDCEGARSARREPQAQQLELQQKELTSLLAWTEVSADLTAYLAARAKATPSTTAAGTVSASGKAGRAATAGAHRKLHSKQQQHKRPASGYAAAPPRPHLSHAYYSNNSDSATPVVAAAAATAVRIRARGFSARPSLSARAASAGRRTSTVGITVGASAFNNSWPKTSCGTPVSPGGLHNGSVTQSVTPISVTAAQELLEVLESERQRSSKSAYGVAGASTAGSADAWEGDALLRCVNSCDCSSDPHQYTSKQCLCYCSQYSLVAAAATAALASVSTLRSNCTNIYVYIVLKHAVHS